MPYSIGDALAIFFLTCAVVSVFTWPIAIYFRLETVEKKITFEIGELREAVIELCYAISGETDGDDPGGGEDPEEEPSNVVAIGRKVA